MRICWPWHSWHRLFRCDTCLSRRSYHEVITRTSFFWKHNFTEFNALWCSYNLFVICLITARIHYLHKSVILSAYILHDLKFKVVLFCREWLPHTMLTLERSRAMSSQKVTILEFSNSTLRPRVSLVSSSAVASSPTKRVGR